VQYLNQSAIEGVSTDVFQKRQPYPWTNITGTLNADGFQVLRECLPEVSLFERKVGIKRAYGQGPHDRSILHYTPGLELSGPWKEFLGELHGETYQLFLRRMLALPPGKPFILTMEVLCLARLFSLAALRCPPQAGDAYFLFHGGNRLGDELGRPNPDSGRPGTLQGALRPRLR